VRVAVGMVDCVTQVCIDNIREEKPRISDARLIRIVRRRFRGHVRDDAKNITKDPRDHKDRT
jgi:hypothetical protein